MSLDAFLGLAFDSGEPAREALWFSSDQRGEIKNMLGHEPGTLRQRYWGQGLRTAWVLEEIGKERPITIGVAIEGRPHFTAGDPQLQGVPWVGGPLSLFLPTNLSAWGWMDDGKLSQQVDGITGATLSVRAVKKVARLALYLHRQTPYTDTDADEQIAATP